MRKSFGGWIAVLLALGMLTGESRAQAPGARGTVVQFKSESGTVKAYLAKPQGDGPFPAVVLIHEWWGLTDWIKENADRLAQKGYVALAVDLYRGKATNDPGEAHELMRALDQNEAVADLKAGVNYLETQPFVAKAKKLGVLGWCMGGGYSRQLAQASDRIGATIICYGSVTTQPEQVALLKGKPVLGIFGGTDRGIPVAQVRQFGDMLKKNGGTDVNIKVYDDAGHAFMRPGGTSYNAKAATDAWSQIDGFLASHLK